MKLCLLLLFILLHNCYIFALQYNASGRRPSLNATDAVSKAAKYLLKRKEQGNEEENVLPRTVVALAFAVRSGSVPEAVLSLLKKELNIRIYMHLSQKRLKLSLFELAQYVNALYATCQDPRSFYGRNLVAQLRSDVEAAWNRDQNKVSLFPLLTLCIAGDRTADDSKKLEKLFSQIGSDRLSLKALAVMALTCLSVNNYSNQIKVTGFKRDVHLEFNHSDIYTKTLSVQALHALHEKDATKLALLQQHQFPDGSFGDSLSTYYAIPALLNKSLLNLRCKSSSIKVQPTSLRLWDSSTDTGAVTYSLWIDQHSLNVTHSVKINLYWNETFYDVMKRAEEGNEALSFLYDTTRIGKKIYSLAGIPNDAESREAWNLYRVFKGKSVIHSKQNLVKLTGGVDKIWPRDKDHFVFWFERYSN